MWLHPAGFALEPSLESSPDAPGPPQATQPAQIPAPFRPASAYTCNSPFTPPGVNCLAASTPPAVGRDALAAAAPAAAVSSTVPAEDVVGQAQAFLQTVLRSPVLRAALLSLEVGASHPPTEQAGAHGLQWTLAQMLALHFRAGYESVCEEQLLALLWTLEAWGDTSRDRCSTVLYSYIQHLDVCSAQRAWEMAREWETQFRSLQRTMASLQADLLRRLGWRMRLDFHSEVVPCFSLLFSVGQSLAGPRQLPPGDCEPSMPSPRWSAPTPPIPGPHLPHGQDMRPASSELAWGAAGSARLAGCFPDPPSPGRSTAVDHKGPAPKPWPEVPWGGFAAMLCAAIQFQALALSAGSPSDEPEAASAAKRPRQA